MLLNYILNWKVKITHAMIYMMLQKKIINASLNISIKNEFGQFNIKKHTYYHFINTYKYINMPFVTCMMGCFKLNVLTN